MKLTTFKYSEKERVVYEMGKEPGSIVGIDMSHLTEAEQAAFTAIVLDFEGKIQPYMKAFRRFTESKMQSEKSTIVK